MQEVVHETILRAIEESEEEGVRIARRMEQSGQVYQAARCLELVAQRHLGFGATGGEILRYDEPSFGSFHRRIRLLLDAGALFQKAERPRTSRAILLRAVIFVEEAIRKIDSFEDEDQGALCCLGLGFELAGHCCLACAEPDGRAYYQAAQAYWSKAARLRPETLPEWTHHPVSGAVVDCLAIAGRILKMDDLDGEDGLLGRDAFSRLETVLGLYD
ncbi:MAG TPA: hypothetical protein DD435_03385 [Cyanobacteria bacterium UBA8530]|nr:hypothetical protein [Cyanobacteria bacterium UBA8530]